MKCIHMQHVCCAVVHKDTTGINCTNLKGWTPDKVRLFNKMRVNSKRIHNCCWYYFLAYFNVTVGDFWLLEDGSSL